MEFGISVCAVLYKYFAPLELAETLGGVARIGDDILIQRHGHSLTYGWPKHCRISEFRRPTRIKTVVLCGQVFISVA